MNFKHHTTPGKLEEYAFKWSQLRLIIAAVTLVISAPTPIVFELLSSSSSGGLISTLLTVCWLITGAASLYMLYRWNTSGQKVFGKRDPKDTVAFFISVVTGINLGLTPK